MTIDDRIYLVAAAAGLIDTLTINRHAFFRVFEALEKFFEQCQLYTTGIGNSFRCPLQGLMQCVLAAGNMLLHEVIIAGAVFCQIVQKTIE